MAQLTLDGLNQTDPKGFVEALGSIFEYSPWVAEAVVGQRPFANLAVLLQAMRGAVLSAPAAQQLALMRAHPDLAGKAAQAGTLTHHSVNEQTGAGLDRLSATEFAEFQRLNAAYIERFGIPFIVCVRRHTKGSIMRSFAERLEHSSVAEHAAAMAEIFRIAALRLDATVGAPERLNVHGHLSTHVLDTVNGRPAAGVELSLVELSTGDEVARASTNRDGRTDAPLIAGRPVPIGTYELRFRIGEYFAGAGTATADPPFLDVVPLRFSVADAEARYHVPLLVSPWSYSTYRGS